MIGGSRDASFLFSRYHAATLVRKSLTANLQYPRGKHETERNPDARSGWMSMVGLLRCAAGMPPRPLHAALQLGTGINTGFVTAGLMGSAEHGFNYTVFGREVNLASRLEGVSGSGRIIISDLTYLHLLRHAPELAGTCVELFPEKVKGFRDAVRIYEVPWQQNK